jgi:hypothetical protein
MTSDAIIEVCMWTVYTDGYITSGSGIFPKAIRHCYSVNRWKLEKSRRMRTVSDQFQLLTILFVLSFL